MTRTTKTTHAYDLSLLDPQEFEDLIRQLAHNYRKFERLDPIGYLGNDQGRDAVGIEEAKTRQGGKLVDRVWAVQMKRWVKISKPQLLEIIEKAITDKSYPPYGVLVAVATRIPRATYDAFMTAAKAAGVKKPVLWDKTGITDQLALSKNWELPRFYWGYGHALDGTVPVPLALGRSLGVALPVIGRDAELEHLRAASGDVIITGDPASGKSRLALELGDVRFVRRGASEESIADSIRRHKPKWLVVDDAGLNQEQINTLLELRRTKYVFRIALTAWRQDQKDVERALPGASTLTLDRLERRHVGDIVKSLGVKHPYFIGQILDQAHGRPGWAITLAHMAIEGGVQRRRAIDGSALVEEVEPYLKRVGASSTHSMGYLATLATLGWVTDLELREIDKFLNLGTLDREQLVHQAASAGLLDRSGSSWRVAPELLQYALATYWFYTRQHPARIGDLLSAFPAHEPNLLIAMLAAAHNGSPQARRDFEARVTDLSKVNEEIQVTYALLDEAAARRAVEEAPSKVLLKSVTGRFLLPESTEALLDRAENNLLENDIVKFLGELGSRLTPGGEGRFEARARVLELSTAWLDRGQSAPRRMVWARIAAELLNPGVEGNYIDPADQMKWQMMAGFETPDHLAALTTELWPSIAPRLRQLESPALVPIIHTAEEWLRLRRGMTGPLNSKPSPEQQEAADPFCMLVLPVLVEASADKPAAQIVLNDTKRLFGVSIKQKIDPEFRLLSLNQWRLPGHGMRGVGQHQRLIEQLAACWSDEEPSDLMQRVAHWSAEARLVGRDLQGMIGYVMDAVARRTSRIGDLIKAGLDAGLSYEIANLMAVEVASSTTAPGWLDRALAGSARSTALGAVLRQSDNRGAVDVTLAHLGDQDAPLAQSAVLQRGEPDWVVRELIRHPNARIRSTVAIWCAVEPEDKGRPLPPEWYDDWVQAIVVAPTSDGSGGDSYRLGEQLRRLVTRDPEVVERWLLYRIDGDPYDRLWRVPDHAKAVLWQLPAESKERVLAAVGEFDSSALSYFVGTDAAWLAKLIDEGTVTVEAGVRSLSSLDMGRDEPWLEQLRALAPLLLERGADPVWIASSARPSGWVGSEAAANLKVRDWFADLRSDEDPAVRSVAEAGVAMFEAEAKRAEQEERRRRIDGRR